jgi:hypothetical protein
MRKYSVRAWLINEIRPWLRKNISLLKLSLRGNMRIFTTFAPSASIRLNCLSLINLSQHSNILEISLILFSAIPHP